MRQLAPTQRGYKISALVRRVDCSSQIPFPTDGSILHLLFRDATSFRLASEYPDVTYQAIKHRLAQGGG